MRLVRRGIVLLFLASLVVFVAVSLWMGQKLAAPARAIVGPPPDHLPAMAVKIGSESGSTLSGWLLSGTCRCGSVVLMHYIRANRLAMLGRAEFLWRAGYSVLLFDFQAHGESPGEHISFGFLESKDARAAVRYMRRQLPDEPVGVIGVSLGAAAALLGEEPVGADALVLEAVHPTIEEAVTNRIRTRLGPLAKLLAPALLGQLQPLLGFSRSQRRARERIHSVGAPVLIIAGTDDQHTRFSGSRRLFERAPHPKDFWAVEGASHVDFHKYAPDVYEQRILSFFADYLKKEAS